MIKEVFASKLNNFPVICHLNIINQSHSSCILTKTRIIDKYYLLIFGTTIQICNVFLQGTNSNNTEVLHRLQNLWFSRCHILYSAAYFFVKITTWWNSDDSHFSQSSFQSDSSSWRWWFRLTSSSESFTVLYSLGNGDYAH